MFLAHVNSLQASIFSLLAIFSLLLAFVMLGSHWLRNYVYAFAAESWLIAALSAAVAYFGGYKELYVIAVLTALFRGLVLPYLLMGIVREAQCQTRNPCGSAPSFQPRHRSVAGYVCLRDCQSHELSDWYRGKSSCSH